MAGKLELVKQVIDTLRTDTGAGSLVSLTTHTGIAPNGIRIARDSPPVKRRVPFLGVRVETTLPLIGVDATMVKKSRIAFRCYSTNEILAEQIADRVEELLDVRTGLDSAIGYYNFSGSDISVRMSRWANRVGADFDEETDVWNSVVGADVIWVTQPQCF